MPKVLVTGGAGYIGSHTLVYLIQNGFEVISADNFINSFPESLEGIRRITGEKIINYEIDLRDLNAVNQLFSEHSDITSIIHFAALKSVEESVRNPFLYFNNNMNSLLNVLEVAHDFEVNEFIFSSSCTVYGHADTLPVSENSPMKEAESPYGRTKQMGEYMLKDISKQGKMNMISLRYFNPAGAHISGEIGESSRVKAVNLVPVITETAVGERIELTVFGNDYPTRDGSCIRDFIHVMDLAHAHVLALKYLLNKKNTDSYEVFNLGIGEGTTVLEAIEAFQRTTGKSVNFTIGPRRSGDVEQIYSSHKKAKELLGWAPKLNIEDIMKSAWKWQLERKF